MLILSDIHYPIGNLRTIRKIIEREKPSTLVLLGDNIELSMFNDHFKAYHEFFSGLDSFSLSIIFRIVLKLPIG